MPQGHAAVKWTPENNAKLLAAVVTMQSAAIDTKKLAAVFGPNVPASAISYRLGTLRKEGAAMGVGADGSAGGLKVANRARAVPKSNSQSRKPGGMLNDPESDEESGDVKADVEVKEEKNLAGNGSTTHRTSASNGNKKIQKIISGRVTKKRASSRKTGKKDYKALDDPFQAMNGTTNGDDEKVFDTEKSESEDSYPSDEEYMKDAKAASIKMEEAI